MNKVINVGLIGFGMSGQLFQGPFITSVPGLKLKKVVERSGEKSKERYPWVEVVRNADDVISDPEIELVIVSLPNMFHYEIAKKALLAEKHVVVEKPFTVTSDEANKLIDISKKQGRLLSVYQNRRFDGDFMTVKKVIESGVLGRLVEYEAHFDRYLNFLRPSAWKESDGPGTGILYDLGSHLIDQAQALFGLPKTITADMGIRRDAGKNIDYFDLVMNYDRLKVILKAGMTVREQGPHFTVHGTSGSYIKYGMDQQEESVKRGLSPLKTLDWGVEPEERWGVLNTDINGLHFRGKVETIPGRYHTYYENIYNAIVDGEELLVKPEHGRNTIRIIEFAIKSNIEKKAVEFVL